MALRVLVVGAGIGGLGLAHGLRRAGVDVRVFERESRSAAAGPSYRLRLDEFGVRALDRLLPPDLAERFRATGAPVRASAAAVFDQRLTQLVAWGDATATVDPQRISVVIDRRALGETLLAGLDDVVAFGRAAVAATGTGDTARVDFADGGTETGDLVVAADGVDSVLRAGIAPDAEVVDTGLRGISGRTPLDPGALADLPAALHAGQSPIVGPDGLTMLVGVCDYVQWTLIGLPEAFGASVDLDALSPVARRDLAAGLTRDWSPVLHGLIARTGPDAVDLHPLRAAIGVPDWPTTRVTALGDAVHATTAFGGSGGSVALRDAEELATRLADVAAGRVGLLDAVGGYEAEMRTYGAEAALRSLRGAERLFRVYIPALG